MPCPLQHLQVSDAWHRVLRRVHHKNSHRQNNRPIGPFVLDRDTSADGTTFINNLTFWLEHCIPRPGSDVTTHAFWEPSTGQPWGQATYRAWFKRRIKAATGVEITPNMLRHIFVDERMRADAVAGPNDAGIAQVRLRPAAPCRRAMCGATDQPTHGRRSHDRR